MAIKAVNEAVHKLQLALLEGIEAEKQLLATGTLISKSDYNDVVTERSIADLCGYPLCSNPSPPADSRTRKGPYRISLKEHKVYDVRENYLYCSTNCLVNSKAFSGSLNEERSVVVNEKKIKEVLRVVIGKVEDDENVESKIVKLFGGLEVKENENAERNVGGVSVGGGGASDAIEGYVPQHKPKPVPPRSKGVNDKTNKLNTKNDLSFNEMDFKSVIITNDEYSISKSPCGSTETESKSKFVEPEEQEDGEILDNRCTTSGSLASIKDDSCMNSRESTGRDELAAQEMPSALDAIEGHAPQTRSMIKSSIKKKEGVNSKTNKPNSKKDLLFNEMDFTSVIMTNDEYSISKPHCGSTKTISKTKFEETKENADGENLEDQCAALGSLALIKDDSCRKSKTVVKAELSAQKVPSASVLPLTGSNISTVDAEREIQVEKESISGVSMPKSSLKSSGSKKVGLSVTWADEKIDGCGSTDLFEVRDMGDDGNDNNADDMLRFASAEACAMALSRVAEAVMSVDSDVADAVSEAGVIILPSPHDGHEGESMENPDVLEPEAALLKRPSKPGIPRSELFDPEDSWYDEPPEGFSLMLSPFATMWMAIFAWISSSSLAYIYGRDESFHEEYLSVNGREYSQKIIMGDGHSSAIKQTLSGCLARTFPALVADLRLRIPVSTLEKGLHSEDVNIHCDLKLELLMNLNVNVNADPDSTGLFPGNFSNMLAFKVKQWQVITVLFLDALSVCRIPALTPHMTNRTMLLRKNMGMDYTYCANAATAA
ncbi:putative RNA polymerase II subunit B1 CTD phosphatase RPAP2-like [Citrus sinensis]|uniref:RNA polymerase II subunit B1 CTD phosphatase RPAP2-like n=1 Tax=Citrus sinensis TaxID=2711 RepID=A0ACB8JMJ3_CITSI|nr:putative RNA polymerase II subunit B1 CTD phosphatase RPAP2-like [Citrus sinensis]